MDKSLTILHLNKGNAELESRVQHINSVLNEYKPSILSLNELNLHNYDKITPKQFPGYKLESDGLAKSYWKDRTGVLISNN